MGGGQMGAPSLTNDPDGINPIHCLQLIRGKSNVRTENSVFKWFRLETIDIDNPEKLIT